MLGLGLGLGKGGSLLKNAASILYKQYTDRVIGFGGTLYNAACLANKLGALNSAKYLANLSGILIFSGVREDSIMGQTPSNGDLDPSFTRGSAATYADSSGNNRTAPDNLLLQSVWSGVGTNVAPTGWTLFTGAGSSTADILASGTIYSNNRILCRSTAGGSRYITQTRTAYAYETYTLSVYIDVVSVTSQLSQVMSVTGTGISLLNESYREDGVVVSGTTNIKAGSRYSYTFTLGGNVTLNMNIGGGVVSNIIYNFTMSRPMIVFGSDIINYVTTTDRQNFPRITFENPDGSLSTCGRHIAEPSRSNAIRNTQMVGAVEGTPGTNPTNWTAFNSGLTRTISAVGIEKGYQYIDYRFNGTATGTSCGITFEGIGSVAVVAGTTRTLSVLAKLVSGTFNSCIIVWDEYNSVPAYLNTKSTTISVGANLTRYFLTNTIATGATIAVPGIQFTLTNGVAYDFRVRIALPQFELGAYATSPIRCFTASTTRAVESFAKGDIYATNIIGAGGGIMFLDMKNTVAYVRENANLAWYLSTNQFGVTGDGLVISNSTTASTRPQIGKYVSGVYTQLYQLLSDNNKILFRWNGTVVDVFVNGSKVVTGSSFTAVAMNWFGYDTVPYPVYVEEVDFSNNPSLWPDAACISRTT